MNSGFAHTASGWSLHGSGQPGSPISRFAVPALVDRTVKRSRSTPDVASAQPSATSPGSTVAPNWKLTTEIWAIRSGSPLDGATQVHDAEHCPVTQALAAVPSHCSAPSRTLLPQRDGGDTV